jgi:hypothetical protein
MSQLQIDLHRRLNEQLEKWISDGIQLYEIADLSPKDYFIDALISLLRTTDNIAYALNIDKAVIFRIFNEIRKQREELKCQQPNQR